MNDNRTKETKVRLVGIYVKVQPVDKEEKWWVITNGDSIQGEFGTEVEAVEAAKKMVGDAIIKALVKISDKLQSDNIEVGAL